MKLRQEDLSTNWVTVFASTNRFKPEELQYRHSIGLELPVATNDTTELTRYAMQLTERLYRDGYRYKKVGVLLTGLVPSQLQQGNLFDDPTWQRERNG